MPFWAICTLLGALIVAAAIVWAVLVRRAHRRRPLPKKGPATPRYPVVLAHGLMGFDEIAVAGQRHAYFRKVRDRLEASRWEVNVARVARTGSVAERARELARFIEAIDAPRVNVVAHSMGGLDARWAIAKLGLAKKVASLTTVGTPHHGTPLADLGRGLSEKVGLRQLLAALGLPFEALDDLTTSRASFFNEEAPMSPDVACGCVVAVARRQSKTNPLLWPTRLYLSMSAGENDGLIPAASQRWGDVLAEIEADHLAQIGWSSHFNAVEFYADLLRELRGRGF
ncbi:MAG TPA: alpha/beta fold hydrolase [Kofleriaceae bacterium]|nr:alpha/beta fold hydrolase [Kofleriaceae bacterium]